MKMFRICALLVVGLLVAGISTFTGAAWGEESRQNLAKESQNPISTLISLPFENNTTFNNGECLSGRSCPGWRQLVN
jgi:hypothetical protein